MPRAASALLLVLLASTAGAQDARQATDVTSADTNVRGSSIRDGVSRRVTKGDVVIIPGHTPHWWSELETDIEYLIFRPDPDNRPPPR